MALDNPPTISPQFTQVMNRARELSTMFPAYFEDAKHDHYADFGWPTEITTAMLRQTYKRNGMARAAVSKTIRKTWETNPVLAEGEDLTESKLELEVKRMFAKRRIWQKLAKADRYALVAGYAGVIFRYADNKKFNEPVETVPNGLDGLVDILVVRKHQLTVIKWDEDEASDTYGQPSMYSFNEQASKENGKPNALREVTIHRDRVMIWSEDGTLDAESQAEAGYNDLMSMEKISGAGGEGFWKNAKSAPVLQMDKDLSIAAMAESLGVEAAGVADKMDEIVEAWQKGFDQTLLLQGIEAKTLGVTLPSPEHFYNVALQSFAASWDIPQKILVGSQTGERASTEDSREWNLTNQSRRNDVVIPAIEAFIGRLKGVGVLTDTEWTPIWAPLTDSSEDQKLGRSKVMADINKSAEATDELVFTSEEMRIAAGYPAAIDNPEGDE